MGDTYIKMRTSTLLKRLFKSPDLDGFLIKNEESLHMPLFHEYILELAEKREEIQEHVIRRSCIERSYGHQLFRGTRKPSRDKVLQLAFGFQLNVQETQALLKIARKSELYPKIRRDAAILFCLNHEKNMQETQETLASLGLTLFGGEDKNG